MHACPKGGKDWQFKRISTFIATIFAGVPRTRPLVNITTCFSAFWEEGAAQAELVYTQKDLDLVEDLGLAAGFTSRRPPRNYPWVSAWRDGAEAKLHGEVFRRFIRGWLQTGVDRRRIKGV